MGLTQTFFKNFHYQLLYFSTPLGTLEYKRSCAKMKDKNQENILDATNPIREKLKDRHSVDFSSATRRRLALFYQKRDE